MGQTNRQYPIFEVAPLCHNLPPCGAGERAMEGDIIAIRPPGQGAGRKERTRFLWLRLQGLEENEMGQLTTPLEEDGIIYDKRRYGIPLARLKQLHPSLDLVRTRNSTDIYQPFSNGIDEDLTPGRMTYADVLTTLQGEGNTLAQAQSILAPLIAHIKLTQQREVHRLPSLHLFRIAGTFYLTPPTPYRREGFFHTPPRALPVQGLVYDKLLGKYL